MKKIIVFLISIAILCTCFSCICFVNADNTVISVGTLASSLDKTALESAGYEIVDDTDSDLIYAWPYDLNSRHTSDKVYGSSAIHNLGQVSATISYVFEGSYLAVAFAENYWAAEVVISVDGVELGSYTPYNPEAPKEAPGDSKIIFVKNDLSEGKHVLKISHRTSKLSGDDNVKADGNAYYDNDAFFDCLIIKKQVDKEEEETPTSVKTGTDILKYNDDLLASWGLKAIDNTNEEIIYVWPYDHEAANTQSNACYGGSGQSQLGQVSGSLAYDFEGTFLAVAYGELYYACKIIIDIDGEVVAEVTPHSLIKNADGSIPLQSTIIYAADDLLPGYHTVTITHETAFESGEDNVRGDGIAYYDNYAFFDCFIVQSEPTQPTAKPTQSPTETPVETPVATQAPENTQASTEVPDGGDKSNSGCGGSSAIAQIMLILGACLVIKKKR